ncbi:MAG: response regulator transcription factor [Betaproteobacteria bacterium]|nr:response regulator transcription factor [Betaproteobacteria bacterium]
MSRILIVDDHALFREALRDFLSQDPDLEIVGEAENISDAIRCVGALSPHLVLTDLTMPDAHGIEAVTEIKRHYPNVKVLVMSVHRESEYKHRCRKAGAAGYIVKDAIHDQLRDGIRTVLSGKIYVGADAADGTVADYAVGLGAGKQGRRHFVH